MLYTVTMRMVGKLEITVDAEDEEDAASKARTEATIDDLFEWSIEAVEDIEEDE